MPVLEVETNASKTQVSGITSVTKSEFLIGRSSDCALNIPIKAISRNHCKLEKISVEDTSKWLIVVLSSRGLFVNTTELKIDQSVELKCGDRITFAGCIVFKFECSADERKSCGRCCGIYRLENVSSSSCGTVCSGKDDDSVVTIDCSPSVEATKAADKNRRPSLLTDDMDCFSAAERSITSECRPSSPDSLHSKSGASLSKSNELVSVIENVTSFVESDADASRWTVTDGLCDNERPLSKTRAAKCVNEFERIDSPSSYITTNDESRIVDKNKNERYEARIELLERKLKEKTNVEFELDASKEENKVLRDKITELRKTLAEMEVMELEFKYLKETLKYKEEDKRAKDALERTISELKNENSALKTKNENQLFNYNLLENEHQRMKQKYEELEQSRKNAVPCGGGGGGGGGGDATTKNEFCCDMVREVKSSLVDLMENEFNCSICGDMFIEATVTNCNHVFCAYCLKEWKKKKKQCPFCRASITKECKAAVIDEYITNLTKLVSDQMYSDRLQMIDERKVVDAQPPSKKLRMRGATAANRAANFPQPQNLVGNPRSGVNNDNA